MGCDLRLKALNLKVEVNAPIHLLFASGFGTEDSNLPHQSGMAFESRPATRRRICFVAHGKSTREPRRS